MRDVLGTFVKQPIPGLVKTRLAAGVGDETAAALSQAFQGDLIARFRETGDRRFLCVAPSTTQAMNWFYEAGGDDYELWLQPPGSLGLRLQNFFEFAKEQGGGKIVVIGSDSPTLPVGLVKVAYRMLQAYDCVLGPATDGGYYLVGLKRMLPLFEDIAWSTSQVLGQTVSRLKACHASLGLLPPWYDVDRPEDLEPLRGHLSALEYAQDRTVETLSQTQQILNGE